MSRRLGLESLENRLLLAGNVTVQVSGGDLVVNGDSQDNRIQIVQVMQNGQPVAGKFYVTGQNGTKINGQTAGREFSNVTDDMTIKLKGGHDRVTLGSGTSIIDFVVPDDLDIDMGEGTDKVTLDKILVLDDVSIKTSGGLDFVWINATLGSFSNQDGADHNLSIETGDAGDIVYLWDTVVPGDLSIEAGNDNSHDTLILYNTQAGDDITINTGSGDDEVVLSLVGALDDLRINTAGGRDTVEIDQCNVDDLFADLGSGIDSLNLRTTVGRKADLKGGSDADTLTASGNNFSESYQMSSF